MAEGSEAEREAVKRASLHSTRKEKLASVYKMKARQDVEFYFDGDMAKNGDVKFYLSAKNTSEEMRDIDLAMYATAMYYTGVPGEELGHHKISFELPPGKSKIWALNSYAMSMNPKYWILRNLAASTEIYILQN